MKNLNTLFAYGKKFREPFASLPKSKSCSKYSPPMIKQSNLSPAISDFLYYLFRQDLMHQNNEYIQMYKDLSSNKYVVEYDYLDSSNYEISEILSIDFEKDTLKGAVIQNGHFDNYEFSRTEHNGSLLFLLFFDKIFQDEEFATNFDIVKNAFASNKFDTEEFVNATYIISDNIYRRITTKNLDLCFIQNFIPDNDILSLLKMSDIREINQDIANEDLSIHLMGYYIKNMRYLQCLKENPTKVKVDKINSIYKIDNKKSFTNEEINLIPIMDDTYVPQKEVLEIGFLIQSSLSGNLPNNNILLTGMPSSGKSTAAKAIAASLELPFVAMNFGENTEWGEIVGQILPTTQDEDLPSIQEIYENPAVSYYDMTGSLKNEDGNEPTVKDAVNIWSIRKQEQNTRKDFVFAETPFVKAIKNGWVIEMQELNALTKSIAINLHMILEEGILIMPNGEIIQRHPNNVVIATINPQKGTIQTESDRLGLALLSRFNLTYEMNLPELDIMVQRAMAKTGNDDYDMIYEMANIIHDINMEMRDKGITDGVCDMRSLNAWAENAKYVDNSNGLISVYSLGITTVINKISQTPGINEEFMKYLNESSFSINSYGGL